MALAAGQVQSGGVVRDADGRVVVVVKQAVTPVLSGGQRDADGRLLLHLENAS